jgi:hypothetical protein
LAQIIAKQSNRPFYELSAINSGVKDIRDVIEKAKQSGGLFTANLTGWMRFIVLVNRSKIHFGSTEKPVR